MELLKSREATARTARDQAANDLGGHIHDCPVCTPSGIRCGTGHVLHNAYRHAMDAVDAARDGRRL
jgi:hypothetical protein